MPRSPRHFRRPVVLACVLLVVACSDGSGPTATVPVAPSAPGVLPEGVTAAEGAAQGRVLGYVESVDPFRGALTLAGDVSLQITRDTWVQNGGITELPDLLAAVLNGKVVLGDAEGFFEDHVFVATRIRFDEGGTCDECGVLGQESFVDLTGYVRQVDPSEGTLGLLGDLPTLTGPFTSYEPDQVCGCGDLSDVATNIAGDKTVSAFLRGIIRAGVLHAERIKFEVVGDCPGAGDGQEDPHEPGEDGEQGGDEGDHGEEGEDEGEDEGAGDELETIVGVIAAVDILGGTITLVDGTVIKLTGDSIFDTTGKVLSLLDLSIKLALGIKVRVEALCLPAVDAFLAVKVKLLLI